MENDKGYFYRWDNNRPEEINFYNDIDNFYISIGLIIDIISTGESDDKVVEIHNGIISYDGRDFIFVELLEKVIVDVLSEIDDSIVQLTSMIISQVELVENSLANSSIGNDTIEAIMTISQIGQKLKILRNSQETIKEQIFSAKEKGLTEVDKSLLQDPSCLN